MTEVNDKEVKVTLVKALNLIENPDNWITGAECRIVGRHEGNHAPKFGYCTIGALRAVTGGYKKPEPPPIQWAEVDDQEGPECVPRPGRSETDVARDKAATVALGEALEELDYTDVWVNDYPDEVHDYETARDQIVEFNDGMADHSDVVKVFRKAIERVAARMKGTNKVT